MQPWHKTRPPPLRTEVWDGHMPWAVPNWMKTNQENHILLGRTCKSQVNEEQRSQSNLECILNNAISARHLCVSRASLGSLGPWGFSCHVYVQQTLRAKDDLHTSFTEDLKNDQMTPFKYLTGNINSTQAKLDSSFFQRPATAPPTAHNVTSKPDTWKVCLPLPVLRRSPGLSSALQTLRHYPLLSIFPVPGSHRVQPALQHPCNSLFSPEV